MPILHSHDVQIPDADALELFADLEQEAEREPYRNYKSVLRLVMDGFAARLKFQPNNGERECLVHSLKHWMPFPDTVEALRILKSIFGLAVISNVMIIFSRSRNAT